MIFPFLKYRTTGTETNVLTTDFQGYDKMKLCAIQIPFANDHRNTETSIDIAIAELNKCDTSCDLILTPEYSNAPGNFPVGSLIPFVKEHTDALISAAKAAAIRCNAVVAVNYLCEVAPGEFRNTTRVFDRSGNIAGDFYKQHLPMAEKRGGTDFAYTWQFNAPEIVEVDGIKLGFLICYDTYFQEYIVHLASKHPDVVLVSSFQRAERQDVLRFLNQNLAFTCNAFVLRSSVSMGENAEVGGNSMVVSPDGRILAEFGSKVGTLSCNVENIHYKYMRSNSFSGSMIPNDRFLSQGRTPWCYRPAGSMVIPGVKDLPYPRVCAHRGFSTAAPENTIAAYGAAVALGAQEIEMDVRFTKDEIPVTIHDDFLERISDGTGVVQEHTLEELKKMDFGSKFGPKFAGTQISTLEEILAKFARQVIINLHIKSVGETYPERFFKKILTLLEKYDMLEHVYFMATPEIQELAEKFAPQIPRCMSGDAGKWEIVDNAIKHNCQMVQFFAPCYDQAMIDKAREHGLICNLYFSDTPKDVPELFARGIDTLLTNDFFLVFQAAKKYIETNNISYLK